jgi:hypothetical protein
MVQQVSLVKVMIASPGDVSQERHLARMVMDEWNAIYATDRGIVLQSVGWDTHSSPAMGNRAQAIISKQILHDCDLLVAIFWTRLGSPTGVAASGTVEEIEEHLAAGRPAMLYFSTAPVLPDSIDQANYTALKTFKAHCRDRGLIHEYDDLATFKADFARHLAQTVIRSFIAHSASAAAAPDSESQQERPALVRLSTDAHAVLDSAVQEDGSVMKISTLGGTHVQAGSTTLTSEPGSARDEARWIAAVDELLANTLVEDRTGKGQVFFVTHRGYDVADSLGPCAPEPLDPRE